MRSPFENDHCHRIDKVTLSIDSHLRPPVDEREAVEIVYFEMSVTVKDDERLEG